MSNLSRLQQIAQDHFIVIANQQWGSDTSRALRDFLPRVKAVHNAIDYESIRDALTIFYSPSGTVPPIGELPFAVDEPNRLALHNSGSLTIQVHHNGMMHVWKTSIDLELIQRDTIVYRFHVQHGEQVWIDGAEAVLPESMKYARAFGLSRFKDLAQCLDHYATNLARPSECAILNDTWREPNRVMWSRAPEKRMQKSLYQYLKSALREGNPDIIQEEPVDGVNPVDITVRWGDASRIALIEVKWLGKSGYLDPPHVTDEHSEKDARDGFEQLAAYMVSTRNRAGGFDRRGFLFVFDARRAKVKPETTELSKEDGLAYEDAHIVFQDELLSRSDLAHPIRCFCEPLLGGGSSPSKVARRASPRNPRNKPKAA